MCETNKTDSHKRVTLDELSERVLSPEISQAFKVVDLEVTEKKCEIIVEGLELERLQIQAHIRSLFLASVLLVLSIAFLITSLNVCITLLLSR